MLAVVTVVGSALFIQGLGGITDFNTFLAVFSEEGETDMVHESIIIEHVRFHPENESVGFWLRNTGLTTVTIDRITMVKVDTQDLIINKDLAEEIFGKEINLINVTGHTLPGSLTKWNESYDDDNNPGTPDAALEDSEYRISVTSVRGNSFETTAAPFNT